jgi:hypothetical protein
MSASSLIAFKDRVARKTTRSLIVVLFENETITNHAIRLFASSLIVKKVDEDIEVFSVEIFHPCGNSCSTYIHPSQAASIYTATNGTLLNLRPPDSLPARIFYSRNSISLCGGVAMAAAAPVSIDSGLTELFSRVFLANPPLVTALGHPESSRARRASKISRSPDQ